jgi:hypothetical protein
VSDGQLIAWLTGLGIGQILGAVIGAQAALAFDRWSARRRR